MKKIVSLFLTLIILAALSIPCFADENITNNVVDTSGSITINGISTTNTYAIYKLLHLESYDTTSGTYAYKVSSAWTGFFATAEAKAYIATDSDGYVTWVSAEDDDTKAAFAKLALAWAKEKGIDPVKSSANTGEFEIDGTTGKFSDLELGYYLVDSTMGALCGLTTTNPNASINAKNGIPTIEKQVKEDSTSQWGKTNTADIGQIVEFRVTINVHAGAENYVLHDTMDEGFTFGEVTLIQHVIPGAVTDTHDVPAAKYTVKTGTDVSIDSCDFEVHFTHEFCDELETNNKIVIYYTAMLNRNAVIAGAGNDNTAWLTFGEGNKSNKDIVTTSTYGIDIIKTDSSNKLIDGAEFRIYDAATGGNEVKVVLMGDGVTYRRARIDETGVSIVVKDGQVRVVGFDNGTYYLHETVQPKGYNILSSRQKFIISDANLDATFNDGIYSTGSGVHVVNKTGSMLPETGGIGTVLFVTVGTIVVLSAGVLLVTKKRMSMIQD